MRPNKGTILNLLPDIAAANIPPILRGTSSKSPNAIANRRSEPSMFTNTGNPVPVLSNNNAGPPAFTTRSVISATSNTGSTSTTTRLNSPAPSNFSINLCIFLSFFVPFSQKGTEKPRVPAVGKYFVSAL
jgi:hypothetical protein